MATDEIAATATDLDLERGQQLVMAGSYDQAAEFFEQVIAADPEAKLAYWCLGLALLLQGQEAEAQTTWLVGMAEGDDAQIAQWTAELVAVLEAEADRQAMLPDYPTAWLLRQYVREFAPDRVENLLHLILLAIELKTFSLQNLEAWDVINQLHNYPLGSVNEQLVLATLEHVLANSPPEFLLMPFTEVCALHVQDAQALVEVILPAASEIATAKKIPALAAFITELCREKEPDHRGILAALSQFHRNATNYAKAIEAAEHFLQIGKNHSDRIFANQLILQGMLGATGYQQEIAEALRRHEHLLADIIAEQPTDLTLIEAKRLPVSTFCLSYIRDSLEQNHLLQNRVNALACANLQRIDQERVDRFRQGHLVRRAQATDKKLLKIGYLCSCFYQHPVGWLARWLLANHDRDRVQVYVYFVSHQVDDMLQLQYREMADVSHQFGNDGAEIADQIFQDEIDILVDLDSITLDTTCHTVSLKPAPVQATWLGWDASGLPTIDHFIADPYVLPDHAQAHYTERIWRLPHTYLAVGGFELGVPTLRRDQLDIPADAVVYLSAQRGFKRHPNTTRLQMKILAGVSNSYFLIKGQSDQGAIHAFFMEMAKAEGVDPYRLRFLPEMPLEATHRANLAIADVVLDTYPYNGATTTMETLWVGVPLVTRVGEQFVARNSYTMLKNAGIEEGIAWSDEEYVEWGIRYGTDPVLRQQVAWKLHQSRQTAPLWNAQQFTRDMEDAYEQMWQLYLESVSS